MKIAPRFLIRLTALVGTTLVPCSCVTTPANLKVDLRHEEMRGSLGALLEKAVAAPESGESGHALAHFVTDWFDQRRRATSGEIVEGERRFRVTFVAGEPGSYLPDYFDQIEPAVLFKVKKIKHHMRDGIGAPLLAVRKNQKREAIEKYYPPEAIARPLTAIAFEEGERDGFRQVTVRLLCPLCFETVDHAGETYPLAADFSVPWAALLAKSKGLARTELGDVITSNPERQPQLYLMEPYDPRKEPLIMIHGLLDSPLKWAQLSNNLWAKKDIRERYQIWHYLYNTSAPALYSGRLLRNQLRELRPMLDPGLDDPAMQSTTILAHSMGGIVSRSLITRPGNAFWDAALKKPLDALKLSPEDREDLKEAFFWEPERHVKKVIFVAVPHRGSDIADTIFAKIGRLFVGPPEKFSRFYERISSANPGAFTKAYEELGSGKLDSVHALSPKQPTLKILSELPLSHPVAIHSIIGNRGKRGKLEDSHDGLVPYWSSHLESADSETVLPLGHYLFEHPEGEVEIVRILRLPKGVR